MPRALMPASPPQPPSTRRLIILGSTGSIGTQTLEVVDHLNARHAQGSWPVRFRVVGIAARGGDRLHEQAARLGIPPATLTLTPERLIREVDCDLVVAAMSASAGLPATLAAVELGRDIALANKETLVAAGELIIAAADRSGSRLLPVDSEHSGLWQCLGSAHHLIPAAPPLIAGPEVARVFLTASGGPFRTWTAAQLAAATPEQALKHPTWSMGPKVTIDSASLVNKALEVIEARWLFGLAPGQIQVLIHPQSVLHAAAEFADGSLIAQMGAPDMRVPIQYALSFPHRPAGAWRRLSLADLQRLDFEPPDRERFPALGLAYRALKEGGTAGAIFNGASEAATEAFQEGRLRFNLIGPAVERAMDRLGCSPLRGLGDALEADARARDAVADYVASLS
jgi:1-deoxy-D-xylulose-5-phosphate reductoisomerase